MLHRDTPGSAARWSSRGGSTDTCHGGAEALHGAAVILHNGDPQSDSTEVVSDSGCDEADPGSFLVPSTALCLPHPLLQSHSNPEPCSCISPCTVSEMREREAKSLVQGPTGGKQQRQGSSLTPRPRLSLTSLDSPSPGRQCSSHCLPQTQSPADHGQPSPLSAAPLEFATSCTRPWSQGEAGGQGGLCHPKALAGRWILKA